MSYSLTSQSTRTHKCVRALRALASCAPVISNVMLPRKRHLYFFRPGEEARMLARCQFGAFEDGTAGVTLTYPIKGIPWRRNTMKSFPLDLSRETASILFAEPKRIRAEFPAHCLDSEALWNDVSEKGNGIARDKQTGTLCYSIAITAASGAVEEAFSLREDDVALTSSPLFQVISEFIKPLEKVSV